jgi:hypothetical protein
MKRRSDEQAIQRCVIQHLEARKSLPRPATGRRHLARHNKRSPLRRRRLRRLNSHIDNVISNILQSEWLIVPPAMIGCLRSGDCDISPEGAFAHSCAGPVHATSANGGSVRETAHVPTKAAAIAAAERICAVRDIMVGLV